MPAPRGPGVALTLALGLIQAGAEAAPPRAAPLSEPARWLQQYVRIDTSNPPGREGEGSAFLASILHRHGLATRLLVTPEGRTSLYARLPGAGTEPPLVLLHHIDVVPPGDGWTVPPFAGEVRDGRLWGRGAIDDKSLGIAHLAAFLDAAGRPGTRSRGIVFLAVADEEAGGGRGVAWLLAHHPELLDGAAAVLGEGGANRAADGRVRWWGIEVAQKRPLWLRVSAEGREGHASSINLHAAPHRLVRALARLLERPLVYRVTDEARSYFRAVAPFESPGLRPLFLDLDGAIGPAGEPRRSLPPGLPGYLLDSLQITVLDAGESVNATPGAATALIDARLLPDSDEEAFLATVRSALGDDATAEVVLRAPRTNPSPPSGPLWDALAAALAPTAPVVPAFIPGVTDSRYFRERGIPAYGFSPFPLSGADMRGIHGPDEHIPLAAFERGVEVMRQVVERWTDGQAGR